MTLHYGLSTWTDGPEAAVVVYQKSDERVIELPGVNIAPGNEDVADQFGNKPCTHLKTDGDLYCLPDQFQVRKHSWHDGWYYIAVGRTGIDGTACTQVEFCSVGDSISVQYGSISLEYGPVSDCHAGQYLQGHYSGHLGDLGDYAGHCIGQVDRFGTCAMDAYTDSNGMKWPYNGPTRNAFRPGVWYSDFDIRSFIPNFNGYTFNDVIASVVFSLRGLVDEAQMIQCTKEYWKLSLSECLVDALNGLRLLHINSIAYLRDFVELPRALSIIKEIKHHPLSKKTWADTYLTYRYGLRLFANDTISIAKAINKEIDRSTEPFQTARSTRKRTVKSVFGNDIEQTMRVKVYADNYSLNDMSLIEKARDIDLYPSLSNVWDFIPYTFVVDWLIPIGDILGKLDAYSDVQDLHTRSCVASVKSTKLDHISGIFGYGGDIKVVCYQRKVLTPNAMSRALSSDSTNFLSGVTPLHFFDGLALRLQRR